MFLSVPAGGGSGAALPFLGPQVQLSHLPQTWMGGKRASFPHPYHHKRDEKWGLLSHAHNFGDGSPTPALTGLLHCPALAGVSQPRNCEHWRADPAPRQGGTTEPTLLVKVWVCQAPRCEHGRAAHFSFTCGGMG